MSLEQDQVGESSDSFADWKSSFLDPDADGLVEEEDVVSLGDLTRSNFSPLFRRVTSMSPEIQTRFFAAFFEGIGYRNMEAFGQGLNRLLHTPWLRPQPDLSIDRLKPAVTRAHDIFARWRDEKSEIGVVVLTDINQVLQLQEVLEEKDPNSYGFAHTYLEHVYYKLGDAKSKQAQKHKEHNDLESFEYIDPQWFVNFYLTGLAFEEAKRISSKANIKMEGTGEEIQKKLEKLPDALIPHISVIIDGYLASLDAGIEPNPFEPLIELYEAGVSPLGGTSDTFYVFIPGLEETQVKPSSEPVSGHKLL